MSRERAQALWASFYHAHGAQVMYDAYGWESATDRRVKREESVYEFTAPAQNFEVVGWGSLTPSHAEPTEVFLACGIFPRFEKRGFRMEIRNFLTDIAAVSGFKLAIVQVYKDNERHYQRCIEETKRANSPWIYAGDVWFPVPGYGMFVRDLCPTPEPAAAALKEAA
jgi:hypothetical protein